MMMGLVGSGCGQDDDEAVAPHLLMEEAGAGVLAHAFMLAEAGLSWPVRW